MSSVTLRSGSLYKIPKPKSPSVVLPPLQPREPVRPMKLPVLVICLFAFAKASLQAPWMNLQDAPKQRAAALLANLTLLEKLHFFHGSGDG